MPESINRSLVGMSPIQLRGYYVREFNFRINSDFDPGKPSESSFNDLQFKFQLGSLDKKDIQEDSEIYEFWESMFSVKYESGGTARINSPYCFSISITGLFCLNKKSYEKRGMQMGNKAFIEHNSQSILYGIVRQIVSSFMDKGPFPSAILPTLFFSPVNIAPPDKA
ncbi:MAG: hypothetical protein RR373_09010 [Akkermansia sp.]